ncbi:hypothetical protein BJ742DRAFT_785618 [Cladochytrium replicatum]|nr:hypothetical protein BJ742DRAFT_785618 [Cladochytrium replicatum]
MADEAGAYAPPSDAPPQGPPELPIVVIDHQASSDQESRDAFLAWLRLAVLHHGNFYLTNAIDQDLLDRVQDHVVKLFALPEDIKRSISVENSPHFFGYTAANSAATGKTVDSKEAFEFGSDTPCVWKEGDPDVKRFRPGPNLYPENVDELLPGFKEDVRAYNHALAALAEQYAGFIAEALGLPADSFASLLDANSKSNGRVKFTRYPASPEGSSTVAEGRHRDMWLTFTMPVDGLFGFQFQNESQSSITVPLITDTFIVSIGSVLETVTGSAALCTPRRILSPAFGAEDGYSIVFQAELSPDVQFSDLLNLGDVEKIGEEAKTVAKARRARRRAGFDKVKKVMAGLKAFSLGSGTSLAAAAASAAEKKSSFEVKTIGEAAFYARIRSRPNTAKRWYPEVAEKIASASA